MSRIAVLTLLLAVAWSPVLPGALSAQERGLCVIASRANLRTGPGTNYRISWEVHRFMPLIEVTRQADWVKVRDVDGDIHWIWNRLVSAKVKCVTVKSSKANIRKRPTTRSEKWFTVEKYSSFKFIEKRNNWVKVQHDGQTMYVYHTLVWPG